MKGRTAKYWILLALYGLVLTGVLLYVRFPAAKIESYLGRLTSIVTGGVRVESEGCGYAPPLALQCRKLTLAGRESGEVLASLTNLRVVPIASGIGLKYSLDGEFAGGTCKAQLSLSPMAGTVAFRSVELKGVDLRKTGVGNRAAQREIKGLLDFAGTGSFDISDGTISGLNGKVTIRDGGFALRQPIMLVEFMEMAPLEVQTKYHKGSLQLSEGVFRGRQLAGTFRGEVATTGAVEEWGLAVAGELTPIKEYVEANPLVVRLVGRLQREYNSEGLPYQLNGSLAEPRFRFGAQ